MPAEIPEEAATEPGPADQAEQSWVAWRVHRALEELPEREREVIALAYWSGLSQSEVAEFLAIPLGTVKTRTRAALQRLADILEGDLELE
jgi:RNA polymerase sigma-70 factor (ECF subfamily)